jgi:ABC-type branched-subunit amino acid transport system substrate-binding protein
MEGPMSAALSKARQRNAPISSRIPDSVLARHPAATVAPAPHTPAELDRLLELLRQAKADTVSIGHGRHRTSVAATQALTEAWTASGGTMLHIADWPATAASWLRPAKRLTANTPDALVIADTPDGGAQLLRRLAGQPNWTPRRTFGFASLASTVLITLASPVVLTGMSGATADGGSWRIGHGVLVRTHDLNSPTGDV